MAVLYIDTCVFIAAFESKTDVSRSSRILFEALAGLPAGLAVTSELTIAELLAPTKMPTALTFDEKREVYLRLLDEGYFVELVPISRQILMETTTLRRDHHQRMPDAIYIATAVSLECRYFVSFDRDARRLPPSLRWVTPTEKDVAELIDALHA